MAAATLVGLLAGSRAATQTPTDPAPRPDVRASERFLHRLQQAVDGHDRRAVTALMRFPVIVLASGFTIPVSGPSELVRLYDIVFTPEMRCAIVKSRFGATPKATAAAPAGADGLSIATGLVWAQRDGETFRITRLIVPPSTSPARVVREPRRVVFFEGRHGEPPTARFSGILTRDEVDGYVVTAKGGQALNIKIDGFHARDAVLRVADRKDGPPIQPSHGDGERTWTGRIPVAADYRIDVVRRARFCDPPMLYTIVMTLK